MIKLTNIYEQINATKYTIYCDMDGVLCDFDKRYQQTTGMLPKDYETKYGISAFWDAINDEGVKFWAGMEWMPGGQQLWDYIAKYNPTLLSAPSREESSKIGKRLWVKRNMAGTKLILASRERKQLYSGENQILIDDRTDNIDEWKSKGGIGILYKTSEQTINELKNLGL
jgi:hypothetical protein